MKKFLLASLALLSFGFPAWADSPVTSTTFSEAYGDLAWVQAASQNHVLTPEMGAILTDSQTPLDQKLALVNALGWKFEGQQNHQRLLEILRKNYQQPGAAPEILPLNGEEKLILGYMMVLDDYFHPRPGLVWVRRGARQLWQYQSAQMVLAIAEAQDYINRPKLWCQVWLQTENALENKSLQKDLRPQAVELIVEYLKLYQPSCTGEKS
ncbi:hypothetical protein COW36_11575 [bacterium (Candidatus Blackallbacteria) CG17_big_fil_post_rev_8_21_14_2_50_48_46]|uniref:Uncharacterized protein n=1 Tax=bacterium (Candidatus Blackallbacteria) CG17_big_fil_post_rev_8_21_14_2_50_48_46 TaxID=2014261 RepID=A0A2M7G4D7_9BACT|nr:MAG: hypothetical protein COW64_21795 [bacterium (Candidatus Blackallbacteria) CG18_big_fil_WC_8_21_14_2_50_49_26]PIW16777.1 MAG: hypothetical protein COW36_11575 [bacterium (Candidatus Blackallbacteria) CG17_big_fil_post_rev_8_21_14_2_50_48_46]PIW49569.1 MAG: hypothetical protein COW20_05495 [bacterium (Candidatus Blackallbacteria) CG13_big_fil_rev_8_21_14_2_50_49_14]